MEEGRGREDEEEVGEKWLEPCLCVMLAWVNDVDEDWANVVVGWIC